MPSKRATTSKGTAVKPGAPRGAEAVDAFLRRARHPKTAEVEAIREIILNAAPGICEGVEWNGPRFHRGEWFATIGMRSKDTVPLVLHMGATVKDNGTGVVTSDEVPGVGGDPIQASRPRENREAMSRAPVREREESVERRASRLPAYRKLVSPPGAGALVTFLLVATSLAAPVPAADEARHDAAWFQSTEQALMDALAVGGREIWDRVMDTSCVVTSEEGEVLTKELFLEGVRALPEGLSGKIAVEDLTVQDAGEVAIVRYLANESESVFGQALSVRYRVTNVYRRDGAAWKMLSSHLSVVTQDPPAQIVSKAGWPGLAGRYRLLPDGWTMTVESKDGDLYGGRDPGTMRRFVPLAPDAFVLSGRLGTWLFVVESGTATRIVNVRKFAVLVWTRVEEAP